MYLKCFFTILFFPQVIINRDNLVKLLAKHTGNVSIMHKH